MNHALLGMIALAGAVLAARRLGHDWRPALNKLTASAGLFAFSVSCAGILGIAGKPDWISLWTLTGNISAAAGGFLLFQSVLGFSRTET